MENQLDCSRPFVISKKKGETYIKYYSGNICEHELLGEIDGAKEQIFVTPFSQARERGYDVHGSEKIISLLVEEKQKFLLEDFSTMVETRELRLDGDIEELFSENEYKKIVEDIVEKEIKNGAGANFLVAQKLSAKIQDFDISTALSIFKKVLETEQGYYLAFIFFDGKQVFIGASPERNVSIDSNKVRMNPISGTFRKAGYKNYLDFRNDFIPFLQDQKEIDELFMASDEELKMMSDICASGGLIVGPILKEMTHLVHTEYLLSGSSHMSPVEVFKRSMWASTVVGSPIESAFQVVKKYESCSRKYYAGAICHLENDQLDSAIMIRTMQIDLLGNLEMYVGASLVKDSDPESEYRELQAKIKGVMSVFTIGNKANMQIQKSFTQDFYLDDEVQEILQKRNQYLSKVWFFQQSSRDRILVNRKIYIIDNEDDFTAMLRHLLHILGYSTELVSYKEIEDPESYISDIDTKDIVLIGPGPGNPLDSTEKMMKNLEIIALLEQQNKPHFGICLGHQLICRYRGIVVKKKSIPTQGEQVEIDLFGKKEKVGFYNSFAGYVESKEDSDIEFSHKDDGEIYALKGESFFSLQFHPESILSQNGLDILRENLSRI